VLPGRGDDVAAHGMRIAEGGWRDDRAPRPHRPAPPSVAARESAPPPSSPTGSGKLRRSS
jgi:hypothetical protein